MRSWRRADLGEALLEISNLIAHVAHFLKRLRGCVFCRCYSDLRRVALLYCLHTCHACQGFCKCSQGNTALLSQSQGQDSGDTVGESLSLLALSEDKRSSMQMQGHVKQQTLLSSDLSCSCSFFSFPSSLCSTVTCSIHYISALHTSSAGCWLHVTFRPALPHTLHASPTK